MIHGASVDELKTRAKAAVMRRFVEMAEQADNVPPTLRAMYVRKAEQAQLVLDGGSSRLIEGEAEIRGITPRQMAQVVLSMAAAGGDELELKRMQMNVLIDQAEDQADVMAILEGLDAHLQVDAQPVLT